MDGPCKLRDTKSSRVTKYVGYCQYNGCFASDKALDMLREWIRKTQSITAGLLKVAAREGKVDHLKYGPN